MTGSAVASCHDRPRAMQRECGHEHDAGRPRQHREPDDDAGVREAPAFGERERGRGRARGRATPSRPPGGRAPSERTRGRAPPGGRRRRRAAPRRSVPAARTRRRREQRDEHAGEHVVAAERPSDAGDQRRVERVEGGFGGGVAVLRDPQEVHRVPARPDVRHRAEVVGQRRVVPAARLRVAQRLERHEREERRSQIAARDQRKISIAERAGRPGGSSFPAAGRCSTR